MPTPTSRLGPALAAALLGGFACAGGDDAPARDSGYETAAAADPHDTRTESASFAVKFKDEVSPHPVMALFAMPGDTVPLEVVLSDTLARYLADEGSAGEGEWLGRQAAGLGLTGGVSTEDLEAVLSGRDQTSEQQLVRDGAAGDPRTADRGGP